MTRQLTSQKILRAAQKLEFCYLCGGVFENDTERIRDHIPPRAIFADVDRDFPLIVGAHRSCNQARSGEDEVIGQLVSLLHGHTPDPHRDQLNVEFVTDSAQGNQLSAIASVNIEAVIRRWLKGFHAALYQQPLPDDTQFATQCPFPSATVKDKRVKSNPVPKQHLIFVNELKKNRMTGSVDTIVCNNGKLKYECVWVQMDDWGWGCIYGLDLYDWKNLGDIHNFPARGCAGLYRLMSARAPLGAVKSTRLEFAVINGDALDPFGD